MHLLVTIFVFGCTFITQNLCDEYMGEFVEWYPSLEYYKFYPKIGNCYEIYDQHKNVTPLICQKPTNPKNHSCIYLLAGDENYCVVLRTPTNEIVPLLCETSQNKLLSYHLDDELNNCFNISRPGKNPEEVCQQAYGNYSIGITTPDNFTILFDSYFCSTSMNYEDRKIYSNFINSYHFDPEAKSCYKIYNKNEEVSPYTCLNDDIFSTCVQELPYTGKCEGIITQNNETVVLHCTGDNAQLQTRCFNIYANNTLHTACQKRVEERCVGITTPSNLTVLLECYYCRKPGIKYTSFDQERQRKYKSFIKTYLANEYLRNNSYYGKSKFDTFPVQEQVKKRGAVFGYWLPNSTCYGFTLESNETVILECISDNKLSNLKSGCFPIIQPNVVMAEEQPVCIEIINETCVGITTPLKWSVALDCYPDYKNLTNGYKLKQRFSEQSVEEFRLYPGINNCYEMYNRSDEIVGPYNCRKSANSKNYSCVQWIPGKKHCLGLQTPENETIELVCGESPEDTLTYNTFSKIKNCFDVYNSESESDNVCLQKFGNYSIGITTPNNYSILFESVFCQPYKTPDQIQKYKEFIGNFSFDSKIRSCYKIYRPDEDIGPYTCLSEEIHEACIHLLEDGNCRGITTQNNETIVLECTNELNSANKTKCLKIYDSNNQEFSVCPKQVEEQCVGIITPSNLTILLECFNCLSTKDGSGLPLYTDEHRKNFRPFVEYAFYVLTQNGNALENKTALTAYTPEQDITFEACNAYVNSYEVHTLHGHDECKGITLPNMETIELDCPNKKPEIVGCYDVFSPVYDKEYKIIGPNRKIKNICVKILNEWCVGIKTPSNWSIPLSCYQYPASLCPDQ